MNPYDQYFNVQVGGGSENFIDHAYYSTGVERVYAGSAYQRSHGGIGSFLADVFRRVCPLFTRGAKTVGKEAMRTGLNIMSDVATGDASNKETLRSRVRESAHMLKRKAEEKIDKLMEVLCLTCA